MLRSISATSVNTYETCPYRWYLNYDVGLKQLPNEAFYIGTMYHKCLELFHGKGLDYKHIVEIIKKEVLESDWENKIEIFGLIRNMFEKYWIPGIRIKEPTIDTEYKFKIAIPGLDIPLIGFIDRIIKGKVVEYKTTSKDYEQEDIINIQTDVYSYAYLNRFGWQEMPTVIYSINNKKKAHTKLYQPQRLEIKRTKGDMNKMELRIANVVDNVNSKCFKPKIGTHCYWCPFGKKGTDNCKYSI